MKKTKNEDGSTSYTLTQTEKVIIWSMVGYFFGRRGGYYSGRRAMALELQRRDEQRS